MGAPITREEYEKIKLMSELKTSVITKLSGRSHATIERIKRSKDWNDYCDIKVASHSQPAKAKNETPAENIREAVEVPEPKPYLVSENLLLSIADCIIYSNALMERVVAKLDAICKGWGIEQ